MTIAREASLRALKTRSGAGIRPAHPVCVFDLAEDLGLEVRFIEIASMEGMYFQGQSPTIMVSSLRPSGRQAFTCAHELGHHCFGHGQRIDDFVAKYDAGEHYDRDEYAADVFAAILLMPKSAVIGGFRRRDIEVKYCRPQDVYLIAGWLGVGYQTLIRHMSRTLGLLDGARSKALLKIPPKTVRSEILAADCNEGLTVVDANWFGRAIDVEVGDLVLLPAGSDVSENLLSPLREHPNGLLTRAQATGLGQVVLPDTEWASYVRVSRRNYVGRNRYRFEEEVDETSTCI